MSYRRFTDTAGTSWEAWEVHPAVIERRLSEERRVVQRTSSDRRKNPLFRLDIPSELRAGWLAVEGEVKRMRVAPIPDGWMTLSDAELVGLVTRAPESDVKH
jgi:hypothetical protein